MLTNLVLMFISYFVIPRLTFLPSSIHSLLIIFGPFLLPKLLGWLNSLRARSASRRVPIQPTPLKVRRALNILFVCAVCWLAATLPQFSPENIFIKTQSRLQIPSDVLFTRLKMLRPLTEQDEILRTKFGSFSNKLAYLIYGPDTLINCIWCTTTDGNDAQNYFYYTLPKLLTPHIVHLVVLGLVTSSYIVGKEGARFRTHAIIIGLFLAVVEAWFIGTMDPGMNKRAVTVQAISFVHWRMRVYRYISFSAIDGLLGLLLWVTSTNRWLATPPSVAERLEQSTRQAEDTMNKLRALGLLANSINRDSALRGVREEYWQTEGQLMAETVQDEAVMEQINRVVSNMDIGQLEGQLGNVADGIVNGIGNLEVHQAASPGQHAHQE